MDFKKLFPIKKKYIYLNSASTGPLPYPSYEKIKEMAKYSCFEGEIEYFKILKPALEELRKNIALFFECRKEEIAFCKNTSHGILLSLLSIPFKKNDNIIVQEDSFPAIRIPSIFSGYEIKLCDFSKEPIKNLKKKINKNTKAVLIDWVHFYKGYVIDLKEIGEFCKEKEIYFIVDGIQGAGVLPLNLSKTPLDFFITGGSKWLLSPHGTGFIYINSETFKKLNKKYTGWLSLDWKNFSNLDDLPLQRKGAQSFEEGTFNSLGIFGFNESMKIFVEIGKNEIYKKVERLILKIRKILEINNFEIIPDKFSQISGIISFKSKNIFEIYKKLIEKNIIVSFRNGYIRVSPHFFNDEDEVLKFEEVISK